MHLISKFKLVICQIKKPICKILRTNKNNNFKFTIKLLMTLDRSYIGYLGFLGIDFLKNVLMYSKGAICLSRLLFKMGLITVCSLPAKKIISRIFKISGALIVKNNPCHSLSFAKSTHFGKHKLKHKLSVREVKPR